MKIRPALVYRARGAMFLAAGILASTGIASSHDLWVVAGRYRLSVGELTRGFVNSGDVFPQSQSLVGEHRIVALDHHGPGGARPLTELRVDGRSLSFDFVPREPGSHIIALGVRPRRVRLRPADFEDYLEENGLEEALALRESLGEQDKPALERYAKWAKAFVEVADPGADSADDEPEDAGEPPAWSVPVGHRLELVPRSDPARLAPGAALEVSVLFDGEPLSGAIVTGGRAGGSEGEARAVSNDGGVARLILPLPGRWYLRSLHLIRVDDDPDVEWESFWCTMTFEVLGVS